jgi:hypothetical protein
MLLFTAAGNVMLAYVLPGLPALAVLTALAIREAREAPGPPGHLLGDRALVATVLAVPASALAALLLVVVPMGDERSQKNLAEAFLAHAHPDATLLYVDDLPHTAEFYTGGRAERIAPSGTVVRPLLRDGEQHYFAIEPEHLERLRKSTGLGRTELLGHFGDFMLRREPGSAVPAS